MNIITVDGPSGSGKGTLCKFVADNMGYLHVDSGLYYRSLGKAVMDSNIDVNDVDTIINLLKTLPTEVKDNPNFRTEKVAEYASKVAVHQPVRDILNGKINTFMKNIKQDGFVIDGRDAGTAIAPKAQVKIFVTAQQEVREKRRQAQETDVNSASGIEKIAKRLQMRDKRDQGRESAPLRVAEDTFIIDTTQLDVQESCNLILKYVQSKLKEKKVA